MQKLKYQNSKGPNVSLRAVNVFDKALRRHVNGRANVDVLKFGSDLVKKYLVNLANPKSAILARPLCIKTLATFKSLWITFCSAK